MTHHDEIIFSFCQVQLLGEFTKTLQCGSSRGLGIHPGRLTWNLQITHFERNIIFQNSIIMFHANLQGCTFFVVAFFFPPTAECYGVFAQYRFRCVLDELGPVPGFDGLKEVPGFRK